MVSNERKKYVEAAKTIERETGYPVSVIVERAGLEWTFPLITTEGSTHALFVILPEKKMGAEFGKIQQLAFNLGVNVQNAWPVSELVKIATRKPEVWSFWLKPLGPLNPFLFHREVYGTYGRKLRRTFYEKFPTQIRQEVERRKKHIEEFLKKQQERTKQHIDENLMKMVEEVMQRKANVLMGFDRSGRPFGLAIRKAIKEAYGISLPLVFIDPTVIRYQKKVEKRHFDQFEKKYSKLVPHLAGARVAFIDDGIGEGKTVGRMTELIQHYQPAAITTVISGYKMTSGTKGYDAHIGVKENKGKFITRVGRTSKGQRQQRMELRRNIAQSARMAGRALARRGS